MRARFLILIPLISGAACTDAGLRLSEPEPRCAADLGTADLPGEDDLAPNGGGRRVHLNVLAGFTEDVYSAMGLAELPGVFSTGQGFGVDNVELAVGFRAGYAGAVDGPTQAMVNGQTVGVFAASLLGDQSALFEALGASSESTVAEGILRRTERDRVSCLRARGSTEAYCVFKGVVGIDDDR